MTDEEKYFTTVVSAIRKDVERAFGILKARWHFLMYSCRLWYLDDITVIVQACLILHNMVIEYERDLDEEDQVYVFETAEDDIDVVPITTDIPFYPLVRLVSMVEQELPILVSISKCSRR